MGKHSQLKNQNDIKIKKKAIVNFIFLTISLLTIFGFCIAIAIRGQKEESVLENRVLNKFQKFSFNDFLV